MAIWSMDRFGYPLHGYGREFDRYPATRNTDWLGRQLQNFYRDADYSVLHRANEAHEVVNDEKKFAVTLDLSHFKPEELKVHIDGRDLTNEGKQKD